MTEQDTREVICQRCSKRVAAEPEMFGIKMLVAYALGPQHSAYANKIICTDCHYALSGGSSTSGHLPTEFKGA